MHFCTGGGQVAPNLLSQCAARRTRHRAFYFGDGRQVGKLNKQAKQIPKQSQKSDGRQVGERKKRPKILQKLAKINLKIGSGTIPGLSGETRGPVWPQGGPGLEKGTKKPRNPISLFAPKWRHGPTFHVFFSVFFLRCSRCRFFMISGARGLSFWLPFWLYFESSGPLGKQLKVL